MEKVGGAYFAQLIEAGLDLSEADDGHRETSTVHTVCDVEGALYTQH